MELHAKHVIANTSTASGSQMFKAVDPAEGREIEPAFTKVTEAEIDRAMQAAKEAFESYRRRTGEDRAVFLEAIADRIMDLGDDLITRGQRETALPEGRLVAERGRTVNQLRLFAKVAREGSWVNARIDIADPQRKPLAKPDTRLMLIPLGPVVVFSASNFPLAFSVAGGDTASALAAGNPVVVKAHWAHPGVSELVARAVQQAAEQTGMPDGVFSMLQGRGHEIGAALAKHPATTAIGFTGSLRGGRALFDVAAARPVPIPVYAEMGSINPVFVLTGALQQRSDKIAEGLVGSVTMGVGQFCTNPGLVIGQAGSALDALIDKASQLIEQALPGSMLYQGLSQAYEEGITRLSESDSVDIVARTLQGADGAKTQGAPHVLRANAASFLNDSQLAQEVFGPSTMFVVADHRQEMEQVARSLEGQLTATLHGTDEDLADYGDLVAILENRVGRIVYNGFPTGVEVCSSMNHGGPYPATTDVHFTSVGSDAILRFARPICYQDFPQASLPPQLRDRNELNIWRMVNESFTQQDY